VAIIQTLRYLVEQMRREEDSFLTCIADCILSCIESYASYFNRWAYIYVGLYGYDYVNAGCKVMELFQARGWSSVVSFDLVSTAMFMVSFMIGFWCGVIRFIFEQMRPDWFIMIGQGAGAFLVSFVVGLLLTSVIMSVVASAVNTVIVCFAEDPAVFQVNHPQLSENLRVAWRSSYPAEFFL
jgi:ABC-type dipeptide/oligopeptide/nickel transport system permease component